jgi:hypothetical protein
MGEREGSYDYHEDMLGARLMPRTCTVCTHARRAAIDAALVSGYEPLRTIADQWSISKTALIRHKSDHLPAHLAAAHEAAEVVRADSLLDQVRALQAKTLAILRKAEGAGDLRTATAAIGQARQNLDLLGRLAGELKTGEGTTVNVGVFSSPGFGEVQVALYQALAPFPEARVAAAAALKAIGHTTDDTGRETA